MQFRYRLVRVLRRLAAEDQGTTLVELMVAVGTIFVALLIVISTAVVAFSGIALARQREGATGLADQTMEQLRALPTKTLQRGLSNSDATISTDPNIAITGSGSTAVYRFAATNERIPHATNTNATPLVPHRQTVVVGPTQYTVSSYITYYQDNLSGNTYRLVVIVEWPNPATGSTYKIQSQSLFDVWQGCLSGTGRPYATPCEPSFSATAGASQSAGVQLTGTVNGVGTLSTLTGLYTPFVTSTMTTEQVDTVRGTSKTSQVLLQLSGQTANGNVPSTVNSSVDDDPTSSLPGYSAPTATGPASSSYSLSGNGNTITLSSSGGDSAASTSVTAATTNPSYLCPNVSGRTNETDALPCGSSTGKLASTMSGVLQLTAGTSNLGAATLASFAGWTSPFLAFTNRNRPGTDDGTMGAELSQSLGTLQLADLPPNGTITRPAQWAGYLVQLSNATRNVVAQAGQSAAAPSTTLGGTVSYWNGNGYTSISVTSATQTISPSVTLSKNLSGKFLTITISGTLTVGGATQSSTLGCSGSCRTAASASANSPVTGTINYSVVYNGSSLANVNINVNLGTLAATTTYKPGP